MIEFILDHWNGDFTDQDSEYYIKEEDIDNSATERILRNQFRNPLWPSDSDDDDHPPNIINWSEIFKRKQPQHFKYFVPCLRPPPSYPRVSELNKRQHNMILKIMSAEYPNVLEDLFLGKPTRQDFKAFESTKETYLKEQKAFKEWAKTLWTTDHCIRALRPKPDVERVYEAEFKMKAQRMQALPKHYDVVAHITLENGSGNCHTVLKQELIRVTLAEMPQVQIPEKIEQQFSIIKPCTVPEPCQKHPYQIVLPNEDALSMLPTTEIHRELAIFAANNETHIIASENALKCLTQWNRHWLLPLSVCDTIGPDGSRVNVLVLDSEFSVHKEAAPMRTYKAFRHLLEQALIPSSERERIWKIRKSRAIKREKFSPVPPKLEEPTAQDVEMSSDDEDNHLFIDTGEDGEMTEPEFAGFASPNEGFGSSKAGLRSSIAGFEPPKVECDTPKAGLRSPRAKFESPKVEFDKAGLRSPKAGFEASKVGLRSPRAGFESPEVEFGTPRAGLRSLQAGFESPKAGLRSSRAGFEPSKAGLRSPRAGFEPPKAGLRSPRAGFESPQVEFGTPREGIRSPRAGFESTKAGLRSPRAGFESPQVEFGTPREGLRSPRAGFEPPKAGVRSPRAAFESPQVEFGTPREGLRSPRAGFESPKAGLRSPRAGFVSPNAGLVSPCTSFGSPNVFTFGSSEAKQVVRGKAEGNPRRSARLSGQESSGRVTRAARRKISEECLEVPDIGLYSCTCQDTLYEKPPRRSFRKWQFKKEGNIQQFDIIIHSPHKAKDRTGELLLEPLPEYQLDLGASEQAPDAVRSAALSLALRKNASLLNVRVEGPTGECATFEKLSSEAFSKRHPDVTQQVFNTIHTALSQLQDLKPGHYVLQHEPSHSRNAMLMCPRSARERHTLQLNFDSGQLIEVDEAQLAKLPPTLTTTLLPWHKHRRVLPCAFTPYENMVVKETKKAQAKKRVPPQAIKFPKRRCKKK